MPVRLQVNMNQLRRSAASLSDACTTLERLNKQVGAQIDTLVKPTNWAGNDADEFKKDAEGLIAMTTDDMKRLRAAADTLEATVATYAAMIDSLKSVIEGKL